MSLEALLVPSELLVAPKHAIDTDTPVGGNVDQIAFCLDVDDDLPLALGPGATGLNL